MVQNIIKLGKKADKILNIVKAQQGLSNKSQAMEFILNIYGDNILEPELRPEYIRKLMKIEKEGYGETFNSIEKLRRKIGS